MQSKKQIIFCISTRACTSYIYKNCLICTHSSIASIITFILTYLVRNECVEKTYHIGLHNNKSDTSYSIPFFTNFSHHRFVLLTFYNYRDDIWQKNVAKKHLVIYYDRLMPLGTLNKFAHIYSYRQLLLDFVQSLQFPRPSNCHCWKPQSKKSTPIGTRQA